MTEYKKYDTKASYTAHFVRLAKDAQVKEHNENTFVQLTYVDSSRLDSDEEMWVDVQVSKFQLAVASYLEKGDVIGVSGKLTYRVWGDDNKGAHTLRNAEVILPPDLIATLKERGFTPGSDAVKGAEEKPKAKGKTAAKPAAAPKAKAKSKPIPVDIDLDDDELGEE